MKGRREGFSLVEVMIVIALIGIVATIAVPNFQNYIRNRNLKTAAQEISSEFFVTRERALAESKRYRIVFDVGNNRYTTEEEVDFVIEHLPPIIRTLRELSPFGRA